MKSVALLIVQPKEDFEASPASTWWLRGGIAFLALSALSFCAGCDSSQSVQKKAPPPATSAPPEPPAAPPLPYFVGAWKAEVSLAAISNTESPASPQAKLETAELAAPSPAAGLSPLVLILEIDEEKGISGGAKWAGSQLQVSGILSEDSLRARLKSDSIHGSFVLHKKGKGFEGALRLTQVSQQGSTVDQNAFGGEVSLLKIKK